MLTKHSYKHMLDFLNNGYGMDESYNLVAIERLSALPKLHELNQDNVLDHLAAISVATVPLLRLARRHSELPIARMPYYDAEDLRGQLQQMARMAPIVKPTANKLLKTINPVRV